MRDASQVRAAEEYCSSQGQFTAGAPARDDLLEHHVGADKPNRYR